MCVRRRIKINKKGSRLALKSENGIDGLSFRSASDGDATSERSTPSPHSNRYPSTVETHRAEGITDNERTRSARVCCKENQSCLL